MSHQSQQSLKSFLKTREKVGLFVVDVILEKEETFDHECRFITYNIAFQVTFSFKYSFTSYNKFPLNPQENQMHHKLC